MEKRKIAGTKLDRRIKINPEELEDITARYQAGEPVRSIARAYEGVYSRRSIIFHLHPERLKVHRENYRRNRVNFPSSSREARRQYMRTHRKYRRALGE